MLLALFLWGFIVWVIYMFSKRKRHPRVVIPYHGHGHVVEETESLASSSDQMGLHSDERVSSGVLERRKLQATHNPNHETTLRHPTKKDVGTQASATFSPEYIATYFGLDLRHFLRSSTESVGPSNQRMLPFPLTIPFPSEDPPSPLPKHETSSATRTSARLALDCLGSCPSPCSSALNDTPVSRISTSSGNSTGAAESHKLKRKSPSPSSRSETEESDNLPATIMRFGRWKVDRVH